MLQREFGGVLSRIGKTDRRVAAVFAHESAECRSAIRVLRRELPGVPIWLFSTLEPPADVRGCIERVFVNRSSAALLLAAESALWPVRVAVTVTAWTGGRGRWPSKLAPFLIPPFRALIQNAHGDFFDGSPSNIATHVCRGIGDRMHAGWNRAKDTRRSLWLHALTTPLRWCGYPDRELFRRLQGDQPLRVEISGEPLGGLVDFKLEGGHWPAGDIDRLLSSTDARWILFHSNGGGAHVVDLLPPFDDARTFAVARQEHYREHRTLLFGMAPFRSLQRGEFSQVMAPLSGSLLVDRAKLAALGIPETGFAESAWLLLFWKAAAAGWRSYSAGSGAQVTRQPDFPLQEREFILHTLADGTLRRLGPRRPELTRGNIAFAAAKRATARRGEPRLKVLLVSPFLPYPITHGGAARIYNLCRALADRVEFTLVALREAGDATNYGKLGEIFKNIYVVDKDDPPDGAPGLPRQVREHHLRSLGALIADLEERIEPDILQVEYMHMAGFRDNAPRTPAVLVEHDLTFTLYRQLAESRPSKAAWLEYERWLAFESRWLKAYDGVWTVSGEDNALAVKVAERPPERTFTVANGVDIDRFRPSPETEEALEVLFVGSFRHLPNILAYERLVLEVMPAVWSRLPEVRLTVVAGPEHERFCRELGGNSELLTANPRVDLNGFVEDLRPLYARAAVVTAPLAVSAGTNIKVLESMACGKAMVTTPAGCSGLGLRDGEEALIAGQWDEFAEAVCRLLSDPGLRARLGAQARRTAVERFSWTAIAEDAYRSYRTLALREARAGDAIFEAR